jgi:hypothetical protein
MRTVLGGDIVYESQVISNDYAQTLTDLVEILAKESR